MSTSVDTSFVKQFEREVHEVFQRHGTFMLQTVRWKSTVKGATTTFQKVGKGVATTKARHGQITPMNQSHTAIECTLSDFYAGDWVDQLDETKVQHDERAVIARGGAAALGRKVDEQIVAVADTSSNDIGGDATLTRAILLQAYETLIGNDVPNDGQLFGFLTPRSWSIAMTISEFANGDFIGQQSLPFLVGANPRTWMGVHWVVHTGLTGKGTPTANNLVWHKNAIGYGSAAVVEGAGQSVKSDITWHGDRASHFVNNMMSGGACLVDDSGVVIISTDDTASIPA